MNMLSDLKIEKKLTAAFAVVILAIIAMGATVFLQVNAMERARMDRARASAVQREAETAQFYWRARKAAIAASCCRTTSTIWSVSPRTGRISTRAWTG